MGSQGELFRVLWRSWPSEGTREDQGNGLLHDLQHSASLGFQNKVLYLCRG